MRSRGLMGFVLAFGWLALTAVPLAAQDRSSDRSQWEIGGLRRAFCVQFLLDSTAEGLGSLPAGYHLVPAGRLRDLHPSLRGVAGTQPGTGAWSPSRLCLYALDSVRSSQFNLTNNKGRKPHLLAVWSVVAAESGGAPRDVALEVYAGSGNMVRSARLVDQSMHEGRLSVGEVPGEDEDGVPRTDRRFQVKLGKTTVTWDGHPSGDSTAVQGVEWTWLAHGTRGGVVTGRVALQPAFTRAMAGSLKIDGNGDLAKALRESPTRFAGPEYFGGTGVITLGH